MKKKLANVNPFLTGTRLFGVSQEWVVAESRLDRVKEFSADECREALKLPDLQKTVRVAIERRLRRLEWVATRWKQRRRRITMTSRTPRRGNDEKHSRQSGDWRSRGGRVIRLFTLKRWIDAYATWREYEEAKLALLNIHHHKNCPGSPGPILHDDEPRSCFRGGAEPACSRWYQWNRIEFLHQKAVKLAGGGAAKRRGLKT